MLVQAIICFVVVFMKRIETHTLYGAQHAIQYDIVDIFSLTQRHSWSHCFRSVSSSLLLALPETYSHTHMLGCFTDFFLQFSLLPGYNELKRLISLAHNADKESSYRCAYIYKDTSAMIACNSRSAMRQVMEWRASHNYRICAYSSNGTLFLHCLLF